MEENNTRQQTEEPAQFSKEQLPELPIIEERAVGQPPEMARPETNEPQPVAVELPQTTLVQPAITFYGLTVAQLKSLLVKILLGCLVAAAVVAVVAVLIGGMSDVVWRSIGTIVVAMLHIAILFGVISMTPSQRSAAAQDTANIVVNAVIIVAIFSFFTAIFNIWDVFDGALAAKLYVTYIVLLVSLLQYKTVSDAGDTHNKLRPFVYAAYGSIILVALLVLGATYSDNAWDMLSGFYGRLLAAAVIIDVTLTTIVAVILHLYLQQHPELRPKAAHRISVGRIVIIVLVCIFVVPMILSLGFSVLLRSGM